MSESRARRKSWYSRKPIPVTPGYQRNVSHCEVSDYVKKVTIKTIESAYNSDKLDRIEFNEVAYEAISQKGLWKVGDLVIWIPGESIIPYELSEKLGVTDYLSKGRVRTIRLRGNRSEGLIAPIETASPYLDKILKWETPPEFQYKDKKSGYNSKHLQKDEIPGLFSKFYKIPNIMNEPHIFKPGESIVVTEKIHGMNFRCAYLQRPSIGWFWDTVYRIMYWITGNKKYDQYQYYVGTHNTVIRDLPGGYNELFWSTFKEQGLKDKIPKDYVFYGELHGPGIQKGFDYGLEKPQIRFFAAIIKSTGNYLTPKFFQWLCWENDLPYIPQLKYEFENIDQLRSLSEKPSSLTDKHIREGIVIVSKENGAKMAKCINFGYLEKDDRTEYH